MTGMFELKGSLLGAYRLSLDLTRHIEKSG